MYFLSHSDISYVYSQEIHMSTRQRNIHIYIYVVPLMYLDPADSPHSSDTLPRHWYRLILILPQGSYPCSDTNKCNTLTRILLTVAPRLGCHRLTLNLLIRPVYFFFQFIIHTNVPNHHLKYSHTLLHPSSDHSMVGSVCKIYIYIKQP